MVYYTYFLKWSKTSMKYYGARGSHIAPDKDLWVNYFTSSKYVKEYRKLFGEPDIVEIRKIFNTSIEAFNWECRVLVKTKSKKSPNWLNRYDRNYNGAYGPKNHGDKVRAALKGVPKNAMHKENLSKAILGSKWVNNGIIQRLLASDIIEEFMATNHDYVFGMLPFSETQRENQSKTRLRLLAEGKITMPDNTGNLPWNTGLTKETSETLKENGIKISKAKIGVPASCPPWNKGKRYNIKKVREYKRLWYTDGEHNMQIKEGDDDAVPPNYYRGRTTGWNTHKDKNVANSLKELE